MHKQKFALVTGANGGIGQAILIALAKSGVHLVAHARQETPEFKALLADIANRYGVQVMAVYFDMTDSEAMKAAVRGLMKDKIPLEILVNCAAKAHGGLFQMTSMEAIKAVFDVNLFAQMTLTQLLLRPMMKQGKGSIINIASIAGIDLKQGNCAYGVSKAALMAFTKTLASEAGVYGVRVNAIAPGLTDTAMAALMQDSASQEMIHASAMKRLAQPEEIANTVAFLASDNATFINGQIIRVDGGAA
jgi:3-oxoacyl-[acyl-carrier protein] reductase